MKILRVCAEAQFKACAPEGKLPKEWQLKPTNESFLYWGIPRIGSYPAGGIVACTIFAPPWKVIFTPNTTSVFMSCSNLFPNPWMHNVIYLFRYATMKGHFMCVVRLRVLKLVGFQNATKHFPESGSLVHRIDKSCKILARSLQTLSRNLSTGKRNWKKKRQFYNYFWMEFDISSFPNLERSMHAALFLIKTNPTIGTNTDYLCETLNLVQG